MNESIDWIFSTVQWALAFAVLPALKWVHSVWMTVRDLRMEVDALKAKAETHDYVKDALHELVGEVKIDRADSNRQAVEQKEIRKAVDEIKLAVARVEVTVSDMKGKMT